jgi:SAM-dependent methyltransferase
MIDNFQYSPTIYNLRAPKIIIPLVLDLVKPKSILDVGCGIGTWLKAVSEFELNDIMGVDGSYVLSSGLLIPRDKFIAHDLSQPLNINRKFDLVISLEVAEHIKPASADIFVESLVTHSDTILFSAAIPGQGGDGHLNEQWPSYWQEKFKKFDYDFYDIIRPKVWNNQEVNTCYKQNSFIVAHSESQIARNYHPADILNLVHPSMLEIIHNRIDRAGLLEKGQLGPKLAYSIFIKSLKHYFFNKKTK